MFSSLVKSISTKCTKTRILDTTREV